MRRLIRIATIVLIGVVIVAAITLTALNLYVQSQGTQERIQQELSQRLKTPVRVDAVGVTPWGGLSLTGITIPSSLPGSSADFLTANSFHLHVSVFSLFSGKLLIRNVSLVNPTVVWMQNEQGKWRLPGSAETERAQSKRHEVREELSGAATPEPAASETPGEVPVGSPLPVVAETPSALHKEKGELVPDVRHVSVSDGNFRFLDRAGQVVAAFEGVNFRATVRKPIGLRGDARIAKMSVHDRFFLESLRSSLSYDPDELELSEITAQAAGGEVNGSFDIKPESQGAPFNAAFKFRNLEADQIVSDAGGPHGMIQGKLEGHFKASGSSSDPEVLTGAGEIALHDGQVQQYSLLVALGQILQIEELTQLHLEQAEAKYRVSPGIVTIDELVLRSPNIRLSAKGTVGFDGKLQLDSQLAINEKVRSQLFKPIRDNFQPIAEQGYSALDFQVGGTVARPKSNLMDRLVGRDLKDFVSGLFGGGKKSEKSEKQKKKKQKEAEESPVDETSPNAGPSEPATPVPSP